MPQVPKTSNNSQNVNPFFKPAWIADISTLGLMTVDFYHDLFVPDFATTSNYTSNITSRALAASKNMTLAQFMDTNVLKITLEAMLGN
jgi:hypothetical protein